MQPLSDNPARSGTAGDHPEVVARQGLDALFADEDHIVGGDQATKDEAALNRTLSDPVKAEKFAQSSRPSERLTTRRLAGCRRRRWTAPRR